MLEEPIKGEIRYNCDTRRFHRYSIVTNCGIIGSVYVPITIQKLPQKIVLEAANEKPSRSRQVEAVISALKQMGGECDSQADLKAAVMAGMNCSEATARRAISEAVRTRQITSAQKFGVGSPQMYKFIESKSTATNDTSEREEDV